MPVLSCETGFMLDLLYVAVPGKKPFWDGGGAGLQVSVSAAPVFWWQTILKPRLELDSVTEEGRGYFLHLF